MKLHSKIFLLIVFVAAVFYPFSSGFGQCSDLTSTETKTISNENRSLSKSVVGTLKDYEDTELFRFEDEDLFHTSLSLIHI